MVCPSWQRHRTGCSLFQFAAAWNFLALHTHASSTTVAEFFCLFISNQSICGIKYYHIPAPSNQSIWLHHTQSIWVSLCCLCELARLLHMCLTSNHNNFTNHNKYHIPIYTMKFNSLTASLAVLLAISLAGSLASSLASSSQIQMQHQATPVYEVCSYFHSYGVSRY